MTTDKVQETINQEPNMNSEHESQDMAEFRERLHDDMMTYRVISAIGNLCQFVGFLNDSIEELTSAIKGTDNNLNNNLREIRMESERIADEVAWPRIQELHKKKR